MSVFSVCGWQQKAEKHSGVPGKGQQWSLFSFSLALVLSAPFVLSTFLLTFDVAWLVVGGQLAEAPGACQRSACYPAGFPVI